MSALAWFLRFAVGNIVGVIAFLFVDIGHLSAGLWIVMAWFPISWFYCIILLMASRLVGFLRIASIPYGAGFTVALFPFGLGRLAHVLGGASVCHTFRRRPASSAQCRHCYLCSLLSLIQSKGLTRRCSSESLCECTNAATRCSVEVES